jgi:hypothetical protein
MVANIDAAPNRNAPMPPRANRPRSVVLVVDPTTSSYGLAGDISNTNFQHG